MGCHAQFPPTYDELAGIQTLKKHWQEQEPIEWVQVYRLPEYVQFQHRAHILKGFDCQTCHGAVEEMDKVFMTPDTIWWPWLLPSSKTSRWAGASTAIARTAPRRTVSPATTRRTRGKPPAMSEIDRREFLKLVGSQRRRGGRQRLLRPAREADPLRHPGRGDHPRACPSSTPRPARNASAACGLHVRTRESRPVKLEGNPQHPVNRGALCARGQASIGRTYHPDRYRGPQQRGADGTLAKIGWDEAQRAIATRIAAAQGKVALLGAPTGPSLSALIDAWLAAVGGGSRVVYEPFAYEALREATSAVFGVASLPIFDLDGCDLVIDFGADAIGTGRSPVEHARQLMAARDVSSAEGRASRLVYVGPRLDETASVADEWIPAKPGSEGALALAVARVAFDAARANGSTPGGDPALLEGMLAGLRAGERSPSAPACRPT